MHDIEPHYGWEKYYQAHTDPQSPFYGRQYITTHYTQEIYGYYIHPLWDYIDSETLYVKILYTNYKRRFSIIELFGEWNDTLHNDVMFLKRKVIDLLNRQGINQYILIGENVMNFHGSDDLYYEEWFEDVEDGWIAALNFRYFVYDEWRKFNIDSYINFGGTLEIENWRTYTPQNLYEYVNGQIMRRLT